MDHLKSLLPSRTGSNARLPSGELADAKGNTDGLLRFFKSAFFNEWICVQYLYQSTQPGVHDYLCNKLFEMSDEAVERYLLELVYLAASKPGGSLEQTIVVLCSKSFRVALKVYWLVLALCQDHAAMPASQAKAAGKHLEGLRDRVERAALEGKWALPFQDTSPTPTLSPFVNESRQGLGSNVIQGSNEEGDDRSLSSPPPRSPLSVAIPVPSLSGDRSIEGSSAASGSRSPTSRIRQDTFGATLDFIEALCDASSVLTNFSNDERQKALRNGLEGINREIDAAAGKDIAIWFPSSTLAGVPKINERVMRLAAKEAVLLNSREKAPFMLFVEVIQTADTSAQNGPSSSSSAMNHDNVEVMVQERTSHTHVQSQPGSLSLSNLLTGNPLTGNPLLVPRTSSFGSTGSGGVSGGMFVMPLRSKTRSQADLPSQVLPSIIQVSQTPNLSAPRLPISPSAPHLANEVGLASDLETPGTSQAIDSPRSYRISDAAPSGPPSSCSSSVASVAPHLQTHPLPHYHNDPAMALVSQQLDQQEDSVSTCSASRHQLEDKTLAVKSLATNSLPPTAGASTSSKSGFLGGWRFSFAQSPPAGKVAPLAVNPSSPSQLGSGLPPRGPTKSMGEGTILSRVPPPSDLSGRMATALASLRGEAPLVRLRIEVLPEASPPPSSLQRNSLQASPSAGGSGGGEASSADGAKSLSQESNSPAADPGGKAKGSVFSALSLCAMTAPSVVGEGPWGLGLKVGSFTRQQAKEPKLLSVRIEVAGGINLNLLTSPGKKSRRTPSHEAISLIASKYKVKDIPPAANSGPPTDPSWELDGEDQDQGLSVDGPSWSESIAAATTWTPTHQRSSESSPSSPHHSKNTLSGGSQVAVRQLSGSSLPRQLAPHWISTKQINDQSPSEPTVETQSFTNRAASRTVRSSHSPGFDTAKDKLRRDAVAVYGERWTQKVKRIQKESPHGHCPGWALKCVIVKNGDDCRQEHLALQLIRAFQEIFHESGLPLWVKHYDVLVTSNKTALIEMVTDSLSIHTVKHRSPPGSTLSDHFFSKFVRSSPGCLAAQRRFTESLAAYSIITYLLQIKDRHNGNVLMDDEGRLVHIDFGFMLSNSPGGVNFEAAPFKLTRELLEIMDSDSEGRPSELFDYYKVLMIQGFLACRKHSDRIVLLVKMMSKSGLPCFKAGPDRTVRGLEKRLALGHMEVQVVQMVLSLISDSLDAWRTRQYDYYQRVMNGIL